MPQIPRLPWAHDITPDATIGANIRRRVWCA